jgi:hypothetical protein
MEGITNSSPRLSEDFSKLTNEIKVMSNSESVSLEDFETKRGDHVIKRELRIDLTKPNPFPNGIKLKEIIFVVKSKLIDSAQFDRYTITEVPRQVGDTNVKPAQKILKSVTFMTKDL